MKLSRAVKPISFFKTHAAEIIRELAENGESMVITQNGEARAVVQDIRTYEETQESLALLKLIVQSRRSIERGELRSAGEVMADLEKKIEEDFPR